MQVAHVLLCVVQVQTPDGSEKTSTFKNISKHGRNKQMQMLLQNRADKKNTHSFVNI